VFLEVAAMSLFPELPPPPKSRRQLLIEAYAQDLVKHPPHGVSSLNPTYRPSLVEREAEALRLAKKDVQRVLSVLDGCGEELARRGTLQSLREVLLAWHTADLTKPEVVESLKKRTKKVLEL
jgi:hypothetical protein